MECKYIFFDWGYTLISKFENVDDKINKILEKYNLQWDDIFRKWKSYQILNSLGKITEKEIYEDLSLILNISKEDLEEIDMLLLESHILDEETRHTIIKLYEKGKILSLSEEQADEIWSTLDIIFNSAYETLGYEDILREKDLEEWKKTEISLELLYDSNQIKETSFGLDRYYGALMILEEDGIRYVRYREKYSEGKLSLTSDGLNIFYSGKEFTIQYTKLLRKVIELI